MTIHSAEALTILFLMQKCIEALTTLFLITLLLQIFDISSGYSFGNAYINCFCGLAILNVTVSSHAIEIVLLICHRIFRLVMQEFVEYDPVYVRAQYKKH